MSHVGLVDPNHATLRLAERLVHMLQRGGFTATYKYAVLVALLDLCMELSNAAGAPPTTITTRQLADKVIELYWPHCTPYAEHGVLRQNTCTRVTTTGKHDTQAEILRLLLQFRDRCEASRTPSLARARAAAGPAAWCSGALSAIPSRAASPWIVRPRSVLSDSQCQKKDASSRAWRTGMAVFDVLHSTRSVSRQS